ncbi:hypothetical protein H4582DRAFT_2052722 [Lactarius indigo]|nr:hypothetical protein H4582DRAFT_2052722 [Lactarius indigo]
MSQAPLLHPLEESGQYSYFQAPLCSPRLTESHYDEETPGRPYRGTDLKGGVLLFDIKGLDNVNLNRLVLSRHSTGYSKGYSQFLCRACGICPGDLPLAASGAAKRSSAESLRPEALGEDRPAFRPLRGALPHEARRAAIWSIRIFEVASPPISLIHVVGMVTNRVGETAKWLAKPQPLCRGWGDETEYDQAYELGEARESTLPSFPDVRLPVECTPADSGLRGFSQLPLGLNEFARTHRMTSSSSSGISKSATFQNTKEAFGHEPANGTPNRAHLSPTASPPTTPPNDRNRRLYSGFENPHSAHSTPPCVGTFL